MKFQDSRLSVTSVTPVLKFTQPPRWYYKQKDVQSWDGYSCKATCKNRRTDAVIPSEYVSLWNYKSRLKYERLLNIRKPIHRSQDRQDIHNAWGLQEARIRPWIRTWREKGHLKNLGAYGSIRLKWIFKKQDGSVCSIFIQLRKCICGGLFCTTL